MFLLWLYIMTWNWLTFEREIQNLVDNNNGVYYSPILQNFEYVASHDRKPLWKKIKRLRVNERFLRNWEGYIVVSKKRYSSDTKMKDFYEPNVLALQTCRKNKILIVKAKKLP